jgi:hypothetical protein
VIITAKHQMHMNNVRTADIAWRNAKRDAHARAKIIAAEEVASYLAARDHEIRQAVDAGVPKGRLRTKEILGSLDPKNLEDSLARTAAAANVLAGQLESDPLAGKFSFDVATNILTIKLVGQELEGALWQQDIETTVVGDDRAEFSLCTREDGSKYLSLVTELWIPDRSVQHPTAAWGITHEKDTLAWLAEQA